AFGAAAGWAGGCSFESPPPNHLLPEENRLPNIEPGALGSADATRVGGGGAGTDAVVVSWSPRLAFFGGLTLLPIAGTRWVDASEKTRPFSSNLSFERSLARKSSFMPPSAPVLTGAVAMLRATSEANSCSSRCCLAAT